MVDKTAWHPLCRVKDGHHFDSRGVCIWCGAEATETSGTGMTDHARIHRMQERYDELRSEGKHGHYECMFTVWSEEFELERRMRENQDG